MGTSYGGLLLLQDAQFARVDQQHCVGGIVWRRRKEVDKPQPKGTRDYKNKYRKLPTHEPRELLENL
jgi:hypothetical protein